uniref:RxLR effector protein n=1 Tax=Angiostrongylus cantonensis TaxID=6313 RepID=A0A0K0DI69_ANGCA
MAFNISTLLAAVLDETTTVRHHNYQAPIKKDDGSDTKPDRLHWVQSGEIQHDLFEAALSQWNNLSSNHLTMYAIAHDIKNPSLVELQMMLGMGARKHDYKRARKAVGNRKPRQAYTAHQLEKLESEFQVSNEVYE